MISMKIFAEIGAVLLTSAVSLVVMFGITRLGGKRQIAQLSVFDYANSITVGSIAAEMASDLETWYRPLTALLFYGAAAWLIHLAANKSLKMRLFLDGQSTVLMENGILYKSALQRAALNLNEFLAQARINGFFDLNDIEVAVMETSGLVSFLPKSSCRTVTTGDLAIETGPVSGWNDLILDGVVMEGNLRSAGYDTQWLQTQLHHKGISQSKEVFYAACDRHGHFYACKIK